MNREQYMKEIKYRLRRLPGEDYEKAIDYFEEYFEEAGPDQEQHAIESLGSPELAADQIVRDLVIENASQPKESIHKSLSAVWIGILAIFAMPVGLPLLLAAVLLVFAAVLVVFTLILAFVLVAVVVSLSFIPLTGGSLWLLITSPVNGITTLGVSLIFLGIGSWVVRGSIWICKWMLNLVTKLFGKIVKGGVRNVK